MERANLIIKRAEMKKNKVDLLVLPEHVFSSKSVFSDLMSDMAKK